ncbi:MAG: hypothetical protein ACRCYQ_11280 [Nocardioides sp.]
MSGYSIVLPPPWQRIMLRQDRRQQVARALDHAMGRAPSQIPPDQLAPVRRRLERELAHQLDEAAGRGGVDFYYPAGELHGVALNASFVVCSVRPPAPAHDGLTTPTLAELIRHGAEAVTVADTVWVRSERLDESDGRDVAAGLRSRRVEYLTAVPDDERRWVVVSCSVIGDGDPDSLPTGLVVELFDAIMSTWRWQAGGAEADLTTAAGAPVRGMLDS